MKYQESIEQNYALYLVIPAKMLPSLTYNNPELSIKISL